MPVESDQYQELQDDDGIDWTLREGSNAHTILAFLSEHPEQGFPPTELHVATGIPRGSVGKTVQRLDER